MLRSSPLHTDSYFTYENRGGTPISTDLLKANAETPVNPLTQDLSVMKNAIPNANFGVNIYPSYGIQDAISGISNLPGNIQTTESNAIKLQEQQAQLPVAKAQDDLGLDYLKRLQANPQIAQYVTQTGAGGEVSTGSVPYQNNLFTQSTGGAGNLNLYPTTPAVPQLPGQTQAPTNLPTPPTTSVPHLDFSLGGGGSNPSSFLQGTGITMPPTASSISSAPSIQGTTSTQPSMSLGQAVAANSVLGPNASTAQNVPSSPVPVDTAAAMAGRSPSPADVLDWYTTTQDTRGAEARVERNPDGSPTGRTIIVHDPKYKMADQPINHQTMMANLNGWTPSTTTPSQPIPNAALAAAPAIASAPAAAAVQQKLAQGPLKVDNGATVSPLLSAAVSNPAQVLASGDTRATTNLISQIGGPQWSATDAGPQAPVYKYAPWLNSTAQPNATPVPTATPIAAPRAQPVDLTNHPAVNYLSPAENTKVFQDQYGMTPEEFQARVNNPENTQYVGKAPTAPIGREPDDQHTFTDAQGNSHVYYTDRDNGVPYTKMNVTPYSETRVMPNGQTFDIENQVSKENDMEMMKASLAAGTAGGNWQSLSPSQKEAAFRLASAITNTKYDGDFANKVQLTENALDRVREMQGMMKSMGTNADPTALGLRNQASQIPANIQNRFGGAVKQLTGINIGQADPNAVKLSTQWQAILNAARQEQSTRPLPPGVKTSESIESELGDLGDQNLSTQLDGYATRQGKRLAQLSDWAAAGRLKMPPSAVLKGNAVNFANTATSGADPSMPVDVRSMDEYSKLPDGTYVRNPATGNVVKKGSSGVIGTRQ